MSEEKVRRIKELVAKKAIEGEVSLNSEQIKFPYLSSQAVLWGSEIYKASFQNIQFKLVEFMHDPQAFMKKVMQEKDISKNKYVLSVISALCI
jgi:hypothetical protein